MSHVCVACSDRRMPRKPARSIGTGPNIATWNAARCSGVSDSIRDTRPSFASTERAACSSGDRAFHVSQIPGKASRDGGSPPYAAASTYRELISAPLPRWDSTSAIDHSVS